MNPKIRINNNLLSEADIMALDWSTSTQPKQDKFESASQAERDQMKRLFNQMGITAYTFTDSAGFDRYDGKYTGKTGNEYVFEIKNRQVPSDTYITTLIDADKVEAVINESKKSKHKPALFFFFEDNKVMYQPLSVDQYYQTTTMNIKKTTMGDTTKRNKTMIEFKINNEKLITLK